MIIPRIPTANESPDTTNGIAGDVAVTTPSNTGHASTTATFTGSGSGNGSQIKSCRWFTFENLLVGNRTSVKLKVTHTSSGSTTDPSFSNSSNRFQLQYSTDNGSNWNNIVDRQNFTASQGPTESEVTLSLTQDLTQVQVRDILTASVFFPDTFTVTATATISNIKVEVTVADATLLD